MNKKKIKIYCENCEYFYYTERPYCQYIEVVNISAYDTPITRVPKSTSIHCIDYRRSNKNNNCPYFKKYSKKPKKSIWKFWKNK